jgi:Fe-S cluster biogenesis protein NfuA
MADAHKQSAEVAAGSGEMTLEERVGAALDEIRPHLQRDGGNIEFVAIEGKVVKVRLQGACSGCPMALQTLKQGVENFVREKAPEIESVEAVGLTV